MNISKHLFRTLLGLCLGAGLARAGNPELPVNLNSAGDFVILGKSGITNVPLSDVTGDMGVSPIDSTAITGFALILDGSGEFSTSAQVDGRIYASDYMPPTPTKMTTAISDMETAYTDAAGRTIPDTLNLGAAAGGDRDIGGLTFTPGLHKWDTGGVQVSANVTLDALGDPGAVFIFQIEGDLTVASGQQVVLAGNAQAGNIFWQVKGGAGAVIGTTAHFEGILLTAAKIDVLTGASFNGKLLAQTAVNLQQNTIVNQNALEDYTLTYTALAGGSVVGDSPQTVLEGEDGTSVTADPDPGFFFVQWSDGSNQNPRTDLNVMMDITVEAEFAAIITPYTLTYTAEPGGSIVGISPQVVNEGADGTPVTADPDPGFTFVQWSDGSLDNPRTDTNVMMDITVEAEFEAITYTLTYTADAGGSIVGISPQTVNEGADGSQVTADPDPGFTFVQWSDGSTDNPRTDTNVMMDITVQASFVADPVPCGILVTLGAILENDLSGAFTPNGEEPFYSVVSSDSARMTASITADNRLRSEALATGNVTLTVTASYPTQPDQFHDFDITVVGHPTTVSAVFPPHEPWNPRFTQEFTIRNDESCDAVGIRLLFSDLKDGIVVENQTGTAPDPDGRAAIEMAFDFPAGGSIDLSVVYLASGAFRPDQNPPAVEVQFILADVPPFADGTGGPNIERIQTMPDGRVFLEFNSVPGTTYRIDVMNNFPNGNWVAVALDLRAGGNLTQWIDQGPPATPPREGVRVYRVRAHNDDLAQPGAQDAMFFVLQAKSLKAVVKNDFDGDGRSDIGCFDPVSGVWYVYRSQAGFFQTQFGGPGMVPATGDFDGDGQLDRAVYHEESGQWSFQNTTEGSSRIAWGFSGAMPVTGDFNGDGVTDIGVYSPAHGKWYLYFENEPSREFQFGFPGTVPVVADLDGDGTDDVGCYYPALGAWYFYTSTDGFREFNFGFEGTVPVIGDLDGDGKDDVGCYHAATGNWYFFTSQEGFMNFKFGFPGTSPVTGDYDGDGKDDVGCYYPPEGRWYFFMSADGFKEYTFGFEGTVPLP